MFGLRDADYMLCDNCAVMLANADDSGVGPHDPQPLSLIPTGEILALAYDSEPEFMHRDCEGCGALPGDRHSAVIIQRATEG